MTEDTVQLEPAGYIDSPCRQLWAAALGQLLRDAKAFWQGRRQLDGDPAELEQAFDDVVDAGPMLQWCCRWLDETPEAISRTFIGWAEENE